MANGQRDQTVGVVVIVVGAFVLWLVGTYWYVVVPTASALVAFVIYRTSPMRMEAEAQALNQRLYEEARARMPTDPPAGGREFAHRVMARIDTLAAVPEEVENALVECCIELYHLEPLEVREVPKPPLLADSIEGARYRDTINSLVQISSTSATSAHVEAVLAQTFSGFIAALPRFHDRGDLLATVPLDQCGDSREAIQVLCAGIYYGLQEVHSGTLYRGLRHQLDSNIYEASGYDFERDRVPATKLVNPRDYPGPDIAVAYLKNTPLLPLLKANVALRIPEHIRYEHTTIVGGSGHGKTSLLQHLILGDIEKAIAGGGGFAVIDPKGTLIDLIAQQACFAPGRGSLADRLLIIDPKRDIQYPPSLNMFDLGVDDAALDPAEQMSVRNNALALIEYMFSDLLRVGTTGRQGVSFKYIGDLMLQIPGAHLLTLLDFLEHPDQYTQYFGQLDETTRTYLESQFLTERFDTTRNGLAERVYGVLQLPMMKAMFANTKTKVHLGNAINEGKILLIKADEAFLTTEGCSLFGGVWIALMFQAALARSAIPREQRRGFTLYIDEASMFFSDRLRQLLIKAREYKIGAVFAFQDLEQIESRQVRASVMGSTSTKLVGGLNAHDRHAFAAEMNCSEDFLKTPRKDEARLRTQFAGFIRGITDTPLLLTFPLGAMDRTPKMRASEFDTLVDNNRRLVSNRLDQGESPAAARQPQTEPTTAAAPESSPTPNDATKVDDEKKRRTRYRSMDYTPRDDQED